jgi:hypothetical protein
MSIPDWLIVAGALGSLSFDIAQDDEMRKLCLCASGQNVQKFKSGPYDGPIWSNLIATRRQVIATLSGLSDRQVDQICLWPRMYGRAGRGDPPVDARLDIVYAGEALRCVINGEGLVAVARKFEIDPGYLEKLKMDASGFVSQWIRFSETMGWHEKAIVLREFRKRLNFSVPYVLLPLMGLPGMTAQIARALFNQGVTSPHDIANMQLVDFGRLMGTDETLESWRPMSLLWGKARDWTRYSDDMQDMEDKAMLAAWCTMSYWYRTRDCRAYHSHLCSLASAQSVHFRPCSSNWT